VALAQAAQRSWGCPLPGRAQGQVGWSSEHPGLGEDVPAHGRGVGTRWSSRSLSTQTILGFYASPRDGTFLLESLSYQRSCLNSAASIFFTFLVSLQLRALSQQPEARSLSTAML